MKTGRSACIARATVARSVAESVASRSARWACVPWRADSRMALPLAVSDSVARRRSVDETWRAISLRVTSPFTSVDIDGFTDPFGAEVDEADSDSLIGRLGVAFEYLNRTTNEAGEVRRMQGYGIFNLLYEFMDSGGADVSGFEFDDDNEDFWGEFGAGMTYSFSEQWSIYGEGSYRTALEDFGDSQAIQGSLGIRYNW